MARAKKMFNKKIETPEALALYEEIQQVSKERENLEEEKKNNFKKYYNMEGKYGKKIFPWWAQGNGLRGYDYEYPSEEIHLKEKAEMEEFYNQHIKPLTDKINELCEVEKEQEEKLCVALWGFGTELYFAKRSLASAEKHLAKMLAEVESQKRYIEKCKKEVEEIEKRG